MPRSSLARTGAPLDDAAWTAVAARDAAARGRFVVGVVTTGIYCAPGCPARLPRRENLRLFRTADDAERAGFRACRRCTPRAGAEETTRAAVVRAVAAAIAAAEETPSLAALAAHAGYSPFHLLRLFKAETGLTPRAYAEALRAERLREGLARGEDVAAAAFGAGYGNLRSAYAATGGMTPGRARRGGAGETIRTAFAETRFGPLLVGATARGVCFLGFAEPREALAADLRRRFPRALIVEDDAALAGHLAAVLAYLAAPRAGLSLPLDLQGTAFQKRVWDALQAIPVGERTTYGALAATLGVPEAVRAVAGACARNPVSLAVPCHRVVGRDGTLTGYRWGLARKRALLAAEAGET
ncbi:MAG: methylated-DNA--[protein]-cysteine S-methyltransferase [Acetobacteraceae bacterium]|jgi:AraC family transcriptional regulator of adaptative response/methylated-DNA-[protein]-cysteine methyltransferase|nr:methylated-DNA--[protein]-cysteine S-methyltransferase [Acetobacteraceae bacterium]